MKDVIEFEDGTFYNADCMDVMKDMQDKQFDLCLTDPPYGIGIDGQKKCVCKNPKQNRKEHKNHNWDKKIPDETVFFEIFRTSKNQIIFGGNYFVKFLNDSHKGWLVWDKMQYGLTMSDCELAYTSFDTPTRMFKANRVELLKDYTVHPTQKPVSLFGWCLRLFSKEGDSVLDCFSGSGTTAIACHRGKRRFVCIEKDKEYFEMSVKRYEEEIKQMELF